MSRIARFQHRTLSRLAGTGIHDRLALAAFAALGVLVVLTFGDYAISNDEAVQHHYGELILSYYSSGFLDRTLFQYDNLYLYGGLFDVVAILLDRILPFDIFTIRHFLCALTGIGGIIATWAVARLVAGPRAGLLALLALAVCGPWYGTMFNHTKDVPFAAAMMGATYFLLRGARDLPRPRLFDLSMFGLLLGCALGLRTTGLLMVGYAGLLVLLRLPDLANWNERTRFVGGSLLRALPAFVLAYAIMIAAWPWASLEPLNPVRAIFAFAHFQYTIRTLAFGEIYEMAAVPRWYVPAYLAIKLPLTILGGALIAFIATAWTARRDGILRSAQQREIALLAFIGLFPVLCQVIGHGPAFTGMRHFIFVVPPLAALAGIGFDALLTKLETRSRLRCRRCAGRDHRRFRIQRGHARAPASLRIRLLQSVGLGTGRRFAPFRHGLLGERDAGGGGQPGDLPQPARTQHTRAAIALLVGGLRRAPVLRKQNQGKSTPALGGRLG